MQSIESCKCSACGAVVNPNWKACIVCDHPLNNHKLFDPDDIESMFKILQMPLSEFKKGGYLVRIKSKVLGEEIYLASTEKEATIGRAEGLIVYLADELHNLIKGKATPEDVRAIHLVKQSLNGVLISVEERQEPKPAKKRGAINGK